MATTYDPLASVQAAGPPGTISFIYGLPDPTTFPATALGQMVVTNLPILSKIAGIVIIIAGLHFLGVIRIGFLNRAFQVQAGDTHNMSILGAYVVGLAFAAGWTPCIGPILAGDEKRGHSPKQAALKVLELLSEHES